MIVGSQVTERHVRGHTASNDEASLTPTASDCRCGFATYFPAKFSVPPIGGHLRGAQGQPVLQATGLRTFVE